MLGITLGFSDRSKPGVDEGSGLVLLCVSFGITWVRKLESSGPAEGDPMSNQEGTRVGNKIGLSHGKVLGTKLGVADRRKLGVGRLSGQVLSGGKFEGRSLVYFLGLKVGTEVGLCDVISDGRYLWNIVVGYRKKIVGSTLGESLGTEYADKGGSSVEISGGELEGEELRESGTEV